MEKDTIVSEKNLCRKVSDFIEWLQGQGIIK